MPGSHLAVRPSIWGSAISIDSELFDTLTLVLCSMKEAAIFERLEELRSEGKGMFVSSSFQSHSLPLLHLISRFDKDTPVLFINTGYLFPETIEFKNQIAESMGLVVTDIRSTIPKSHQRDADGNLLFASDPDRCCYLNKTQPMESVLSQYDVWINGVRAIQNANRAQMELEQDAGFGCMRYHPLLHWSNKDIYDYRKLYGLPDHPLESKGYFSIGCEPCTMRMDLDNGRDGRWYGMNKTECGLHIELKKD